MKQLSYAQQLAFVALMCASMMCSVAACQEAGDSPLVPEPLVPEPYDIPAGVTLLDTLRPPAGQIYVGPPIYHRETVYIVAADDDGLQSGPMLLSLSNELELISSTTLGEEFDFGLTYEMQIDRLSERLILTAAAGIQCYDISGPAPVLQWSSSERTGGYPGLATLSPTGSWLYVALDGSRLGRFATHDGRMEILFDGQDEVCSRSSAGITNVTVDAQNDDVFYFVRGGWCIEEGLAYGELYRLDAAERGEDGMAFVDWVLPREVIGDSITGVRTGSTPLIQYEDVLGVLAGSRILGIDRNTGNVLWRRHEIGGIPLDITFGGIVPNDNGLALLADNGTGAVGVIDLATGEEQWARTDLRRNLARSQPYGEDFLYTSFGGASIYRVSATLGDLKWRLRSPIRENEDVSVMPPAVIGRELYFSDVRQLYRLRMEN